MSFSIKLDELKKDDLKNIKKRCTLKSTNTQYGEGKIVECFKEEKNLLTLPIFLKSSLKETFVLKNLYKYHKSPSKKLRCSKNLFTIHETNTKFHFTDNDGNEDMFDLDSKNPPRDQDYVYHQAIKKLKETGTCFLCLPCGFGKTSIAMKLSCRFNEKIAVLSHISLVNDKWEEEYEEFTNAKVQRLEGNKKPSKDADVYIVGVDKATRYTKEDFQHIGIVLFDEAHVSTVKAFSKALLKFSPKYLIGMSATPKRVDGMQKLINLYFGPDDNFIVREEVKDFTVIKVITGIRPTIKMKYNYYSKRMIPDWNILLNSLEYNPERQKIATKICKANPEDKIMILCNRKEQTKAIYENLCKEDFHTQLLVGSIKKYDKDCQILVAGMKKAGVGFDDPTRTLLIEMSDARDVKQFEGRIRTTNNKIYELIDDYKTLFDHSLLRDKWFIKRGAKIVYVDINLEPLSDKEVDQLHQKYSTSKKFIKSKGPEKRLLEAF